VVEMIGAVVGKNEVVMLGISVNTDVTSIDWVYIFGSFVGAVDGESVSVLSIGEGVKFNDGLFVGLVVGKLLGFNRFVVGVNDGLNVGFNVGFNVGLNVGFNVGLNVDFNVGFNVDFDVGLKEGSMIGFNVGFIVGFNVGSNVGSMVGSTVGSAVGIVVGFIDGMNVGSIVGALEGKGVGLFVATVGAKERDHGYIGHTISDPTYWSIFVCIHW